MLDLGVIGAGLMVSAVRCMRVLVDLLLDTTNVVMRGNTRGIVASQLQFGVPGFATTVIRFAI